ncbi:MAG: DEAD/DEAH box helicase [Thermoplasmata archaeon]|nr:DEAD/DEAH box helicase [Thermoplasmata archaeon]
MSDPESTVSPTAKARSTFDDLPLNPRLRAGIREMGYSEPTAIQQGAIPDAVHGRDLIGTAQTGTGKTAAFLLPILERLMNRPRGRIYALVLTPTRELALQAEGFLRQLGRHTGLRGAAVYGGVGMRPQEEALRGAAEIIIATPGRLLDHMSRGYVDFRSLEILVLDEADRMLDMGFLPDVRRIHDRLPRNRQTMLFSATMPPEVVRLSRDFLRDPRMVHVAEKTVAAVGVSHLAVAAPSTQKTGILVQLLQDATMASVLVFVRTKRRADRLVRDLQHARISAGVIHGNRSQSQRVHALESFRTGNHRVLVATDIAARGVDVEGVSHVVNFDVPHEPEIYVHRVGRTARAQRRGQAITLIAPEDSPDFTRIERLLGETIPRATLPGWDYSAAPPPSAPSPQGRGRSSGGRDRFQNRRGRGPPPRRMERRSEGRPSDSGSRAGHSRPRSNRW